VFLADDLGTHSKDTYLDLLRVGAAGFLIKEEDTPALAGNRRLHAIRRAARGEVLYTQKQLERARRWRQEIGARWESPLTFYTT